MYNTNYATQGKAAAKAVIAADPAAPKDLVDLVSQGIDAMTKVADDAIIQVGVSGYDIADASVSIMINIGSLALTPAPTPASGAATPAVSATPAA